MRLIAGLGGIVGSDGLPVDFPSIPITPRCFQYRRLIRNGSDWYVSPSEEPRPSGHGEGGISRSMGMDGYSEPRLVWQSSIPLAGGGDRKPTVIRPAPTEKKGKALSSAAQRKLAGEGAIAFGNGTAKRFYAWPLVQGSTRAPDKGSIVKEYADGAVQWQSSVLASNGDRRKPKKLKPVAAKKAGVSPILANGRFYKRPMLPVYIRDRGKVVKQIGGGPVYWQSRQPLKDGSLTEALTIAPLSEDQISAIEFQAWLDKNYPNPVDRLRYLVDTWKALVIVNHSGGKDSQAMYLHLTRDLGVPHDQIRVVHADLPNADWPGTLDHIKQNVDHDVKVVRAKFSSGALKELYDYVLKRGMFPSAQQRYCTSDLKTSPINSWIRQALCELNGMKKPCNLDKPGSHRVVISTMGMRAEESDNRAGLTEWELNVGESKAGRVWLEYLPIHRWTTPQVFRQIKRHKQKPFWIYGRTPEDRSRLAEAGSLDERGNPVPMQRMSCVFCIMGSLRDVGVASKIGPQEIAETICKTEIETGHTFKKGMSFPELQAKGAKAVEAGWGGLRRQRGRRSKRLNVLSQGQTRKGPCR